MAQASNIPKGVVRELYSRRPDWWARWTWPMVIGIALWTAIGAENVFTRWTQEVQVDSGETPENTSERSQSPTSQVVQRELRPFRERALMSATILGFGTGLGILFLSGRTRIVRRVHGVYNLTPTTNDNAISPTNLHHIVVETLGNIRSGRGKVFARKNCELLRGRNDNEMYLKVQGGTKYWLGLEGALVEGGPVSDGTFATRKQLLKSLGQGDGTGRWVSGPIVEDRNR